VPDELFDQLASSLGSRSAARWVLEDLDGLDDGTRRAAALEIASRRAAGEPLQYLLGHWQFRRLDLLVDPRALIPRPETEALVDLALGALGALDRVPRPSAVVDLGCGSGAIALALATEATAKGLDVEVHATDVSADALSLARANADRAGAAVAFHEGGWYDALPVSLRGGLALVCSNPPYVSHRERASLDRELDFEPELALVAEDTDLAPGFAAVSAVIAGAASWLAPGGTLLVEHGEAQREACLVAARAAGLVDAVDHDDLAGRPRILEARSAP
jgi:release factor glutamine methyltransferase